MFRQRVHRLTVYTLFEDTSEQEEREVTTGDIVHIPAGEKHWHGARKESYMTHITVTAKDSQTTQLED